MAVTYTTLLGLAKPQSGTEDGQWGNIVNDQITDLLDTAVAGASSINVTAGNVTLTDTDGAADQARASILLVTGTPGVSRNIVAPSRSKVYQVINGSDAAVVIKGSATTGVTIPVGAKQTVAWDGSDFVAVNGDVTLTGTQTLTNKTLTSPTINSPTLVTPALGTPSSGTLTSCTGLPLTTGVTGTLDETNGGTGNNTYSTGQILYASSANTLSKLNIGTTGQVLAVSGGIPAWTSVSSGGVTSVTASSPLASSGGATPNISFTGTLAIANGGTGQTSANSALNALLPSQGGNSGKYLQTDGSNTSWESSTVPSTLSVTSVTASSFLRSDVFVDGEFFREETGSTICMELSSSNVQFWRNIGDAFNGSNSCGTSNLRWSAVYAVNGTIQTSDQREKTDIQSSDLGLDFVNQLQPKKYKYIKSGNLVDPDATPENAEQTPGVRYHYGFVAQDVQALFQNSDDFAGWTLGDKNDPNSIQGLRYDQFIAPLTKAIQELSAEVTALKAEVAALKGN